jgi:ribosomal protein S6
MVEAIKRTSEAIFNLGGVIRTMENAGSRQLPYRMFKHGKRFESGKSVVCLICFFTYCKHILLSADESI